MDTLPNLRYKVGSTIAPGDRIGSARHISSGAGTYTRGGHVYASAVGKLNVISIDESGTSATVPTGKNASFVASIVLEEGRLYASSQVLSVGQVVLGRVLRVIKQQATVEIVAADGIGSLRETHVGAIRREDVRSGASEEVEIYSSFRPGDVVLARIISLGDSRRYFLTTAENELGVIRAVCAKSGINMVPISWKEMECPDTKTREPRKCAKPRSTPTVPPIQNGA